MASLQAFESYDFDSNDEWQAYLRSVEIPDVHNVAALRKLKAKWYKRNVHPDFDVASAAPPQPATPQPTTSSPPPSSTTNPTTHPPRGGPPSTPPTTTTPPHWDPTLAILQLLMVLTVPFWVLPLFPRGPQAFRLCCYLGVMVHGSKVLRVHGMPRLRPFPGGLSAWSPQMLALLSPVTLALYHVAVNGRARFGSTALWQRYGTPLYDALSAKRTSAMQMCANSEIMLGFVMVLGILRGISGMMLAYMWWTQLKIRYHAPDFMQQHRQVWHVWQVRAGPYLQRVPLLQRGVQYAQRWFANVQRG